MKLNKKDLAKIIEQFSFEERSRLDLASRDELINRMRLQEKTFNTAINNMYDNIVELREEINKLGKEK